MKKLFVFTLLLIVAICAVGIAFTSKTDVQTKDYLRIHIRANSNSDVDQEVKYKIKDEYVNFLTPKIANCKSKDDVVEVIVENDDELVAIANDVLAKNGFDYTASIKIAREEFPTRTYEGYTLNSGVYDALIVELGEAKGNNWWCVIYPPLCFTDYSSNSFEAVVYKSKIWEIIKQFFN